MIWYKELGFYSNPFSIKPGAFKSELVGYDLSEIIDKIASSNILFIEGEYGFGKTSILKHIIQRFGGRRNVVYYNCNRTESTINAEALLKGKYNPLMRLFADLPEEMVLLLDEVERVSQQDQKELLKLFKSNNIKSLVFFGPNFDKIGFSIEMRKHLVNNVIKLTELTEEEAIQLVRERVGSIKLLEDRIIRQVFKLSEKNPRIMLENLEDLCKYAVENNEEVITEEHIKEVFGSAPKQQAPKKRSRPKRKEAKAPEKAERPAKPKREQPKEKKEEKKEEKKAERKAPKQEKPIEKPIKIVEEKKQRAPARKESPIDEDFPPEEKGPDKKRPTQDFDEEQEQGEGDEESEYFYYY